MKTQKIKQATFLFAIILFTTFSGFASSTRKIISPMLTLPSYPQFILIEEDFSITVKAESTNFVEQASEMEEIFLEENEAELETAQWMVDDDLFRMKDLEKNEDRIEIKPWMTNDILWKHKIRPDEN